MRRPERGLPAALFGLAMVSLVAEALCRQYLADHEHLFAPPVGQVWVDELVVATLDAVGAGFIIAGIAGLTWEAWKHNESRRSWRHAYLNWWRLLTDGAERVMSSLALAYDLPHWYPDLEPVYDGHLDAGSALRFEEHLLEAAQALRSQFEELRIISESVKSGDGSAEALRWYSDLDVGWEQLARTIDEVAASDPSTPELREAASLLVSSRSQWAAAEHGVAATVLDHFRHVRTQRQNELALKSMRMSGETVSKISAAIGAVSGVKCGIWRRRRASRALSEAWNDEPTMAEFEHRLDLISNAIEQLPSPSKGFIRLQLAAADGSDSEKRARSALALVLLKQAWEAEAAARFVEHLVRVLRATRAILVDLGVDLSAQAMRDRLVEEHRRTA